MKLHEHEENDDDRDPKRVRFTHKQPVKRADSEVTDDKDTDAKRAKLCDTPSFSSSSHEIAPKLHDSSGVDESAETRESVTKKPRVDDDMEISAIETLTNAKLEVDRALNTANKMLHRLLEECPLESEAVTKAAELNSIKDKRVYREMARERSRRQDHQRKVGAETAQGTVRTERLRGRREGRRRFRQHDDDSLSEDATLTGNRHLRSEGYTVFTADVETTFLNAHMKDSDVVCARPPPEWQPETLQPTKGTVIWKLRMACEAHRDVGKTIWSRSSRSAASSRTCTRRNEYHSYSTWTTCCWQERTRSSAKSLLN